MKTTIRLVFARMTLSLYRPQTKFAKVMFLHLSVSHSVHRGACVAGAVRMWRGACVVGGCAWQGACVAEGGVCGRGCACHTRPPPNTTRYGRSMRGRYASYWNTFLLKLVANPDHWQTTWLFRIKKFINSITD